MNIKTTVYIVGIAVTKELLEALSSGTKCAGLPEALSKSDNLLQRLVRDTQAMPFHFWLAARVHESPSDIWQAIKVR